MVGQWPRHFVRTFIGIIIFMWCWNEDLFVWLGYFLLPFSPDETRTHSKWKRIPHVVHLWRNTCHRRISLAKGQNYGAFIAIMLACTISLTNSRFTSDLRRVDTRVTSMYCEYSLWRMYIWYDISNLPLWTAFISCPILVNGQGDSLLYQLLCKYPPKWLLHFEDIFTMPQYLFCNG